MATVRACFGVLAILLGVTFALLYLRRKSGDVDITSILGVIAQLATALVAIAAFCGLLNQMAQADQSNRTQFEAVQRQLDAADKPVVVDLPRADFAWVSSEHRLLTIEIEADLLASCQARVDETVFADIGRCGRHAHVIYVSVPVRNVGTGVARLVEGKLRSPYGSIYDASEFVATISPTPNFDQYILAPGEACRFNVAIVDGDTGMFREATNALADMQFYFECRFFALDNLRCWTAEMVFTIENGRWATPGPEVRVSVLPPRQP